jgi:hypothetical protein
VVLYREHLETASRASGPSHGTDPLISWCIGIADGVTVLESLLNRKLYEDILPTMIGGVRIETSWGWDTGLPSLNQLFHKFDDHETLRSWITRVSSPTAQPKDLKGLVECGFRMLNLPVTVVVSRATFKTKAGETKAGGGRKIKQTTNIQHGVDSIKVSCDTTMWQRLVKLAITRNAIVTDLDTTLLRVRQLFVTNPLHSYYLLECVPTEVEVNRARGSEDIRKLVRKLFPQIHSD